MPKTLLIFQKDVRGLRLELAVWITVFGVFGWMEAALPARLVLLRVMVLWEALLGAGACYLIVAVIHEDPLPGDRQAWLTTPIRRSSVFLAKLIFLAIFLNLPLCLSYTIALLANGLTPWHYLPNVIWQQFACTALWVTPAAALAAVTTGLRQFIAALIAGCGAALMFALLQGALKTPDYQWGGVAWVLSAGMAILFLAIAAMVLSLAYLKRDITTARFVLAGGVLFCGLLPTFDLWPLAFQIQELLSPRPGEAARVGLCFDAARHPAMGADAVPSLSGDPVRVEIPIAVTGMPPDAELVCERVRASITMGAVSWNSGWRPDGEFLRGEPQQWEHLDIDRAALDRMRGQNVRLHIRAALTLLGPPSGTPVPIHSAHRYVPGIGFCSAQAQFVGCLTPFRHAALVTAREQTGLGGVSNIMIQPDISYAPYAAGWGFDLWRSDIMAFTFNDVHAAELTFVSREPLAYIEREFDASFRLPAYAQARGGAQQ